MRKTPEKSRSGAGSRLDRTTDDLKEWTEEKLDETFLKYKDETMTKLDEIVDMLQKDDQKRIEKLEKSPLITPAP